MTKFEQKFFDFIKKNIIPLFLLGVTVIGIVIRICGIDFESDDYQSFLAGWWTTIESKGVSGLSEQVGNYNIPYQLITYVFTLLPLGPLYSYKTLSIIFDFVLAVSAAMLVYSFSKNKSFFKASLTYALVLFSIPVVFNSSFWAQCDSIYVSFILLAIYFIHKDRNVLSFVMLGISLAFKLQMIFILPVFLFYYIATRKVSILHFLIIPAVDVLMCLPAIILGRNPMDIINIYVEQTDYGKLIQMNCPNFYALICSGTQIENYHLFKTFSIILTFVVLAIALVMIIYKNVDLKNKENFLLTAIWTIFTCIMFLSSMHERYTYLLDILTIIYALTACKRYWLPVVCNLISLRGYCYYLFAYEVFDLKTAAIIFLAVYFYVTYIFVKDVVINGEKIKVEKITPSENIEIEQVQEESAV